MKRSDLATEPLAGGPEPVRTRLRSLPLASTAQSPSYLQPAPLMQALQQNLEIGHKMERWADDLAAVSDAFARVVAKEHDTELEFALDRCTELEDTILEASEFLSVVNKRLIAGMAEGKNLERRLLHSNSRTRRMTRLALHDPLTGLPNRALFDDRIKQAIAHAEREKQGLTIMFVDLDKFKTVNDFHGHQTGDKVLQAIAQRLLTSMRAEDTVSRRGGDEFVCLMLDLGDEAQIAKLAAKLVERMAAMIEVGDASFMVGASIGIAVFPRDGRLPDTLIARADTAMYQAKRMAKGYAFFGETLLGEPLLNGS